MKEESILILIIAFNYTSCLCRIDFVDIIHFQTGSNWLNSIIIERKIYLWNIDPLKD